LEEIMRAYKAVATAIGVSFFLTTAGAALAADNPTTGGAAGVQGQPGNKSGATQKPGDNNNNGQSTQDQMKKSEQSTGGPGVAGKPGGKSGATQQPDK
jgi:hypothetical protein